MTQYAIHDPEPERFHERHKPGKRVYIAGRITGARFSSSASPSPPSPAFFGDTSR